MICYDNEKFVHKSKQLGDVNMRKKRLIICLAFLVICMGIAVCYLVPRLMWEKPEELLKKYIGYIETGEYEKMYELVAAEESGNITEEAFIERNSRIYEGIEAQNVRVEILGTADSGKTVSYQCSMDTLAGEISFENSARFVKGKRSYELLWDDTLIFPSLGASDVVRVSTKAAKRGRILDRNGNVLAGEGVATSVGIVPGKMKDQYETVRRLAEMLDMDEKSIETKLEAKWVKDDSFVPVKTISKAHVPDVSDMLLGEAFLHENELEEELLDIPGVMLTDTSVRAYPLGEAAAHLIGYVQNVTAEDLEEHKGEGYRADSVIGRSGMEGLYEKELKGQDGCRIYIENANGDTKSILADIAVQDGVDVRLTIDSWMQRALYEQFQEDKSCSVAMNPYTGEVLALVSTPSYDSSLFVLGMSDSQWESLNNDEDRPLYNRFRQIWCPGSSFKPIIAAIGLESGAIDPAQDYGYEGLSWQKDSSWGAYYVTTLHDYSPAVLENAMMYSDNIYFAKAAMRIGSERLCDSLKNMGFGETLPFEILMEKSQYSNTESIESEIQLADSGYGQGQILINPVHLAALYTAFSNEGNVIRPRLLYQEQIQPSTWISSAFSSETVAEVLKGMEMVVNNPEGTGYGAHLDSVSLAGKTGTAEIKASQEDTDGTELGWFAVFTTDKSSETPLLLLSMTEDVKERGGSGYVVEKDRAVLEAYLK